MDFQQSRLHVWGIWTIKLGLCLFMVISAFTAIAQEPAWWTQKKRDCNLSSSLAYNTWVAQGSPCNNSGGNTSDTRISRQEAAENRSAKRHDKANTHNKKGNELYKQGKYGSAVKEYQKAHKLWPDDKTILDNLKSTVSAIPDDAIDKDKVTDKSWWKVKPRFKFHEWADIWKDKEDKGALARQNESGKLNSDALDLANKGDFKKAYDKSNEALEIDPDNNIVIQKNIQEIKKAEVASLNKEMLDLSKSDYEAALLKAREASLADPDNPLTKENLNKIEVQELINEAKGAEDMEAKDIALEKYKKAKAIDPGNQEIQKKINDLEKDIEFEKKKDIEFEKNRIKYTQTKPVNLDGEALKKLKGLSEIDVQKLNRLNEGYMKDVKKDPFDYGIEDGRINLDKIKDPTSTLVNDPAYKKVVEEMKTIQENYKKNSLKIEKIHEKMNDPATKPEELTKMAEEAKNIKKDMEAAKVSFVEKKVEKEIITKSFHITPIK